MGIRDDELEGLSEEERAALADDDDEIDALRKIAGGDDDEDDDDGGDDGDGNGSDDDAGDDAGSGENAASDPGSDSAGAADAAEAAGAAGGETPTAAASSPAAEFIPQLNAEAPEGLADKIAELDTRATDLAAKFKDGEIDLPEFMAQKDAIDRQRIDLTMQVKQAEWAKAQNESTQAQRWRWEQERFFGQDSAKVYQDPILLAAFDASVKGLANAAANASRPAAWFLEEADRQVRARFNLGRENKPAGDENKPAGDGKKAAANRQPDLSKAPKTLANLPAAEIPESGADEFAYLDKLDGIALEVALRKLTPEQEARYLGAAA